MIAKSLDLIRDRSAVSHGMFAVNPFRILDDGWEGGALDRRDRVIAVIHGQPHGTPGQAGQVAVIGEPKAHSRGRLCHTGIVGSRMSTVPTDPDQKMGTHGDIPRR